MAKIKIACPACIAKGTIEIPEEMIKGVTRGLLAVNIPDGTVCEHSFIAYIDKNLNIRDYFMADFKIELPDITPTIVETKKIPSKEVLNLDLIKLNLPAMLLTYILKSIISKEKIIIILDHPFLSGHVHNFFDYITQDTFDVDISIINNEDYKKNKKEYKDSMVFEGNNILNNVNKLLDEKKLKVEKQLVQSFLTESDLSYSYIVLKNELYKVYDLANTVIKQAKADNQTKLNIKYIVDTIAEKYNVKLHKSYLDFLIEIIKNYFGLEIAESADVPDFLGFI